MNLSDLIVGSRREARLLAAQVAYTYRFTAGNPLESAQLARNERSYTSFSSSRSSDREQHSRYYGRLLAGCLNHVSIRVDKLKENHKKHRPVPLLHELIISVAEVAAKELKDDRFFQIYLEELASELLTDDESKSLIKELSKK